MQPPVIKRSASVHHPFRQEGPHARPTLTSRSALGGCWRSQVSSRTAKLLCAYPGIDSAQPASASTQQAFSFGFAANSDSAAPEGAQAEEPGNASIPQADSSTPEEPEATVVAAAQPQRPPAQQLQVSAHSCEAYHAHAMHRGCVAPGLALLIACSGMLTAGHAWILWRAEAWTNSSH